MLTHGIPFECCFKDMESKGEIVWLIHGRMCYHWYSMWATGNIARNDESSIRKHNGLFADLYCS